MNTIERALRRIRAGKMIIVTDDRHRENEADLVMAGEQVTPQAINFMATHGRGLICVTLTKTRAEELRLPLMAKKNTSLHHTNFTVSIDSVRGTTTGIPAKDRAKTILDVVNPKTKPEDLGQPGHVFPIIAHPHGVLGRPGHTEASVDLARLAGCAEVAIVCEILDTAGRSARGTALKNFTQKHNLPIISIAEIIEYRKKINS